MLGRSISLLRSNTCTQRPVCRQLSSTTSNASRLSLPPHSWDSHMHVTDPELFPIAKGAQYQPHKATLHQARENAMRLKLPNMVFVQPSPYGFDNSCLIDSLERTGLENARGVVVCDADHTSIETLEAWHQKGIRGVRINLRSVKRQITKHDLQNLLKRYASRIGPLRTWSIDLHVDLAVVPQLEHAIKEYGIKVIVDHFGGPPGLVSDMSQFRGWTSLLKFMQHDNFYVKVSAPYRFTEDRTFGCAESAVKQLISAKGGSRSVIFASDWPHTRFEDVDIQPFSERCLEWCDNDKVLSEALFRENAKRLWNVN